MKRVASLLAAFMVLCGLPLAILAAEIPEHKGPEIIKMKMGKKTLVFQHRKHQLSNNNECFHCHKHQEWKIRQWDKEVAHQICIACHDLNDKGPVECKGCHSAK